MILKAQAFWMPKTTKKHHHAPSLNGGHGESLIALDGDLGAFAGGDTWKISWKPSFSTDSMFEKILNHLFFFFFLGGMVVGFFRSGGYVGILKKKNDGSRAIESWSRIGDCMAFGGF